jgi:CRP/FNR family transcriptional regulator, cyclic AMP receptor protein
MIPSCYAFGECLRSVFAGAPDSTTRRVGKQSSLYVSGTRDDKMYFITTGQVKVIMLSPGGKECLLDIYTVDDYFGESCLSQNLRSETAIAMSNAVVKEMTGAKFLALLTERGLVGDFVRQLAARVVEQQQIITNLVTIDCEYRLGEVLLRLARKLGACDALGLSQKISHQELSQMVGTTRPRVSEFMQRFRDRGLIGATPDSRILVRVLRLQEYLETRSIEPRLAS